MFAGYIHRFFEMVDCSEDNGASILDGLEDLFDAVQCLPKSGERGKGGSATLWDRAPGTDSVLILVNARHCKFLSISKAAEGKVSGKRKPQVTSGSVEVTWRLLDEAGFMAEVNGSQSKKEGERRKAVNEKRSKKAKNSRKPPAGRGPNPSVLEMVAGKNKKQVRAPSRTVAATPQTQKESSGGTNAGKGGSRTRPSSLRAEKCRAPKAPAKKKKQVRGSSPEARTSAAPTLSQRPWRHTAEGGSTTMVCSASSSAVEGREKKKQRVRGPSQEPSGGTACLTARGLAGTTVSGRAGPTVLHGASSKTMVGGSRAGPGTCGEAVIPSERICGQAEVVIA